MSYQFDEATRREIDFAVAAFENEGAPPLRDDPRPSHVSPLLREFAQYLERKYRRRDAA